MVTKTKTTKKTRTTTVSKKSTVAMIASSKKVTHKSPILQAVHEAAEDLHSIGVIDKTTMREFDAVCLPKVKTYTPAQIKRIRLQSNASQSVFAAYLNTSASTIQKWEQGTKRPNGPSLKLLNLVDSRGLEVLT